jgi:hypothetical protein
MSRLRLPKRALAISSIELPCVYWSFSGSWMISFKNVQNAFNVSIWYKKSNRYVIVNSDFILNKYLLEIKLTTFLELFDKCEIICSWVLFSYQKKNFFLLVWHNYSSSSPTIFAGKYCYIKIWQEPF